MERRCLVNAKRIPHRLLILICQVTWSNLYFGKITLLVFWLFIVEHPQILWLWTTIMLLCLIIWSGKWAGLSWSVLLLYRFLKSPSGWSDLTWLAFWFRCLGSVSFPYGFSASPHGFSKRIVRILGAQGSMDSFSMKVTHDLTTILLKHFSK